MKLSYVSTREKRTKHALPNRAPETVLESRHDPYGDIGVNKVLNVALSLEGGVVVRKLEKSKEPTYLPAGKMTVLYIVRHPSFSCKNGIKDVLGEHSLPQPEPRVLERWTAVLLCMRQLSISYVNRRSIDEQ
jgi:hypothetical protein